VTGLHPSARPANKTREDRASPTSIPFPCQKEKKKAGIPQVPWQQKSGRTKSNDNSNNGRKEKRKMRRKKGTEQLQHPKQGMEKNKRNVAKPSSSFNAYA